MAGLILAGIVGLAALWAGTVYNRLVRRKNLVAEAWSGIDVQLKRRADLIPNLVQTVKAYANHERDTFEALTTLRAVVQAEADVSRRAQAEAAIASGIGRVLAVAEGYPELKASENFRSLQQQLAEIEDQIQLSRRYYNGTVRNLNVMIEQFPANLVARPFGFNAAPFFQIENAGDRDIPNAGISR